MLTPTFYRDLLSPDAGPQLRLIIKGSLIVADWHEFCKKITTTNTHQEVIQMNWDQIQGNWKQFKGKAKEKWGKLTDDDLDVINGKRDQLVGKLQERYGYSKEKAEKAAEDWSKNH
jgi:uncharacterized protein YjbJ (UPF0337 family)